MQKKPILSNNTRRGKKLRRNKSLTPKPEAQATFLDSPKPLASEKRMNRLEAIMQKLSAPDRKPAPGLFVLNADLARRAGLAAGTLVDVDDFAEIILRINTSKKTQAA
jgi:hypothetical protein